MIVIAFGFKQFFLSFAAGPTIIMLRLQGQNVIKLGFLKIAIAQCKRSRPLEDM